jgi:DnaJ family protein A protein 2
MKDYYKILGLSKNASKEEIKLAFRKLAMENHPDKGGKKEKFQEIQEAYEILGNDEKRKKYDRPDMNFNDFNFFFNFNENINRQTKRANHYYNCEITLKDVHFGLTKKIKVKKDIICKICNDNCEKCNGLGKIVEILKMGPFIQQHSHTCNKCSGKGKLYIEKKCNDNLCVDGKINQENIFEINIPKGVEQNKQYKFEGWGEQTIADNEIPGDLIVIINIKPHEIFKRNNLNLIYETSLTLIESIIGKDIQIKVFNEILNINTKIFGIINPSKQYILYEKGLNNDEKRGDLYIIFKINYPEKSLTDDEIKILKNVFNEMSLI